MFGGAERLRLQADVFYAPPWYISSQSLRHFSSDDIGGRVSASFLKPALWGTTNDLLIDALAEKVSTSGAGFVGYQAEDADVTASLRHRFNQNFWVQAGLEAQKGDATDALGTVSGPRSGDDTPRITIALPPAARISRCKSVADCWRASGDFSSARATNASTASGIIGFISRRRGGR